MYVLVSTRRRRVLLTALAVVAGGYASYRLYSSSVFARNRKRLHQIVSSLCFISDAITDSAQSLATLSHDLRSFLLSDADTVPRSIRQVFKIGKCPEIQDCVTVLSTAMVVGLLRASRARNVRDSLMLREEGKASQTRDSTWSDLRASERNWTDSSEELSCRDIMEVCLNIKEDPAFKGEYNEQQQPVFKRGTKKVEVPRDNSSNNELRSPEGLLEKVLLTLFSEGGTRFASAVTGVFTHSCMMGLYQSSQTICADQGIDLMDVSSEKRQGNLKLVDMICSEQCRELICECIQTVVTTAVTVYIEKTKDVNFYEEMVAGMIKSSHRDPMKDLLTSACSSAVETLVRTVHEVMYLRSSKNMCDPSCKFVEQADAPNFSLNAVMQDGVNQALVNSGSSEISETVTEPCLVEGQPFLLNSKHPMKDTPNEKNCGMKTFIEGVSDTLAIPSNRKLVVDVAGTMTSEAVRSFLDVVVSTVSQYFSTNLSEGWNRVKRIVANQVSNQGHELQRKSQDLAMKAFLLSSICLAICLHVLAGLRAVESL